MEAGGVSPDSSKILIYINIYQYHDLMNESKRPRMVRGING